MSDNGPYMQPPQFPQDGEGNSGGQQPPYGGPYGQPGHAQGPPDADQHGSGPHQAPYGIPGSGGQPGYGAQPGPGGPQFQHPHEQQMFQGGQPPYGPGGPGMPGPPGAPGYPPPPRKSNAGLWIVIGGGAVIVILVIAVVAVVLRNVGDDGRSTAAEEQQSGAGGEQQGENQEGENQEGGGEESDAGAKGDPPYELPEEPCDAFSEKAQSDYGLDSPNKNLTDNRSSCSWSVDGEGDTYGSLRVEYNVPYAGADSVEGAKKDFEQAVDMATDEDDNYTEREVHEEQDVDLGDEANLVFGTEQVIANNSVATMLIRTENMNIAVKYSMTPGLGASEDAPAPLEFSDVEDTIHDLGEQSLNHVGN